jgi:(R,R)-butanediol dehydrogenase/meso-butanediol dehydrogenase/diacetyl reductase
MTATMLAARWHACGDVRVEEVPRPEPGPGQLLLRVGWCGICGTDVEEYRQGPVTIPADAPHPLTGRRAPLTLGHEFAGTVAALGRGVESFRPGERLVPEVCLSCGSCEACERGEPALCARWAALGLQDDGGLAEYALVGADACLSVPASLSDEAAALVEPAEVAVRALRKCDLRPGAMAVVVGAGTIGLLVLQAARAAGAEVHVVEPNPSRRALARRLGATEALAAGPEWPAQVRDLCGGSGPDAVIECAGSRDGAGLAIRAARRGGRIVLVGTHPDPVPLSTLEIVVGEKQVIGSVQHDRHRDLPEALRLLADGSLDVAPLITDRIPLERVVPDGLEALANARGEHVKILVGSGA